MNDCNNNGKRQGGISSARMNRLTILCPRIFQYILCASIKTHTALKVIRSIYEVKANLLLKEKLIHLTHPFYKLLNDQIKFM